MDRLTRIQGEIDELRGRLANVRYRELERIARLRGRTLETKKGTALDIRKQGKKLEPIDHSKPPRRANKLSVHDILDQLEGDLVSLQTEQEGYKYGR